MRCAELRNDAFDSGLKEQRTIPLDVVAIAQRARDENRIEQGF